jgi:hypothetical protein
MHHLLRSMALGVNAQRKELLKLSGSFRQNRPLLRFYPRAAWFPFIPPESTKIAVVPLEIRLS